MCDLLNSCLYKCADYSEVLSTGFSEACSFIRLVILNAHEPVQWSELASGIMNVEVCNISSQALL